MSFFWHSRGHPSKPKHAPTTDKSLDKITITSPLRRIHRKDTKVMALSPVASRGGNRNFTPGLLRPQDILSIHTTHTDYICGVVKKRHTCKNSLYCTVHTLQERLAVYRTKPLHELMKEECLNRALYAERRNLAKTVFRCKAYWTGNQFSEDMAATCSHSSCSTKSSEHGFRESKHLSSLAAGKELTKTRWSGELVKKLFLKRLACSHNRSRDDFVSYVFYKLEGYEILELDVRAREIEARFETSR